MLTDLEDALSADVLTYIGQILPRTDDFIRQAVEQRKCRCSLAVILETGGGYIEVTQRIVTTLREHYETVEFYVPNFAYSAGTVLVMAGDAIHMDYYSVLGPIDPQISRAGQESVPALGYLAWYERLINKSKAGTLTTAELSFLVQNFDAAELYRYEQARNLSITLLKEWLVRWKFKNWRQTETRKMQVTRTMKEKRAEEIAEVLNDTTRWHSHTRGISMEVLRSDLNLKIDDFRQNQAVGPKIRNYYQMLSDHMVRQGTRGVVHTAMQYTPLVR